MGKKIFFILTFFLFSLFNLSNATNVVEGERRDIDDKFRYNINFSEENDVYPLESFDFLKSKSDISNRVYLTLEEVTELALQNNFDIQLAKFDAQFKETDLDKVKSIYDTVIEAEARYKDDQTKSASAFSGTHSEAHDYNFGVSKKLPTGTTLGLYSDNQRYWTDSPYTTINPAHDSSIELALSQDLGKNFFGLKDRSDLKITKIDIENVHYTSLDKIEEMLSNVQKTYWRIAKQLKVVEIRKDMLDKADELFRINKEKIKRGIIEQPQLLSSEANFGQREIDVVLALNELESYINELKLLLNIENRDKIILPKEELDLVVRLTELGEALKTAFSHRRDYFKARNEVDSQKIKLVMKGNALWPEINLEASIRRNSLGDHFTQAIKNIGQEDNPEYSLGLKIKFPLENRLAKSEFNKAKIEKAIALLNLKNTERRILVQIEDSVRNCNIFKERAKKQKNVVELQREKLAAELKAYQYGRSDTDTVIRYQDDLLSSELLYTQALLDYKQALIELSLKGNTLLDSFWERE